MVQNLVGCRVSFVALTLTRPIRHCLPSPQSVLPLNSYRNEFRPSQKWHAGYFVRRKREREETLFKTRFSPLTDSFSRPKPLHCQSSMKPHCLRRKWSREVPNSTPAKPLTMRHSGHRERTRARRTACPFRRVTGRGRQHTTHTSIWRHEFHCRSQRCLRDVIVRLTPLRRGRRRRPMRDDSSSCCRRMNFVPIAAPRSRPRPPGEGRGTTGRTDSTRASCDIATCSRLRVSYVHQSNKVTFLHGSART